MDIGIVASTDQGGRSVLSVSGAIDLQTRDKLAEAGRSALGRGGTALVLDLSDVTFMDSTGIGTLVELGHDAEDIQAQLVIRHPSVRVQRILHMTGLDDAWVIEPETESETT